MNPYKILPKINRPSDLNELGLDELHELCGEIREEIVNTVCKNGGHLSSNLGVVELSVALHRVFNGEWDRILWDVGHQSYPHKLLTGRWEKFHTLRQKGGLSGFCNPQESRYDGFISGHGGNTLSAALGIEYCNERKTGEQGNVIAVIGDGCLVNGITLEALNNVSVTCKRLTIVLNDNEMSIDKSTGAFSHYLNRLITGRDYNRLKRFIKQILEHLPGGERAIRRVQHLESLGKQLFVPGIIFEELGIRYIGPIDGHDIPTLLRTFEHVRESEKPSIIHVITEKGHGYEPARLAPTKYHSVGKSGKTEESTEAVRMGYSEMFGKAVSDLMVRDERVRVVCAATLSGCGITDEIRAAHLDKIIDVGIAEEHAAVFAAGMASRGMRPFVAMYSTFFPRVLDCVEHDICLQNLPVTFCLDRAGAVSDGPTHHGLYDTGFLLSLPNLSILAPECPKTLKSMMQAALGQDSPVVIRYPRVFSGAALAEVAEGAGHPLRWGNAEIFQDGHDICIWALGDELETGLAASQILREKYGISAGVVCVRFLRPFDKELLQKQASEMPIATLENNSIHGGLFTVAAEALANERHPGLIPLGYETSMSSESVGRGSIGEIRADHGLNPEAIALRLMKFLEQKKKPSSSAKTTEDNMRKEEKI